MHAGFTRTQRRFGAIGDVELGEDGTDVVAYRLRCQVEPLRDLCVLEPFGQEPEAVPLGARCIAETRSSVPSTCDPPECRTALVRASWAIPMPGWSSAIRTVNLRSSSSTASRQSSIAILGRRSL